LRSVVEPDFCDNLHRNRWSLTHAVGLACPTGPAPGVPCGSSFRTHKSRDITLESSSGPEGDHNFDRSGADDRPALLNNFCILTRKLRRDGRLDPKMIFPGTNSLISVPDAAELRSVSLPPIRALLSRIPCSPKCPSLPLSRTRGSMPTPLSFTRRVRSCA